MNGYSAAVGHLIDHLVRVQLLLERESDEIGDVLDAHDAMIAERVATTGPELELPLVVLARRFGLAPIDLHILIAAALPGLDVVLAQRWQQRLGSTVPERRVYELVDLLAVGVGGGNFVARLAADAPLQQGGLIRLVSGPEWSREAPLLQRVVTVPDAIVDAITGTFALPRELAAVARYRPHTTGVATPELATLGTLLGNGVAPLVVVGPALVGKATAIAIAATELGRGAIVTTLAELAAAGDAIRRLDELACAARLLDAVLIVRTTDTFAAAPLPVQRAVCELAANGRAIVTAHDAQIARQLVRPRVVEIKPPDAATQRAVWASELGDDVLDLAAVVARCPLPIGEIVEAAAAVRSRGEPATVESLIAAGRARLQHRLGDVASLVTTTLDWADLVVREDISQRILEILNAASYRDFVLGTWGFDAKLPYGRSVSALLAGPPGTGKTMVATLIAKQLGLELFRIDLSKVVSKWIGETEKNLGKVFDEASRVGAVLLFDEADALFAKRTEVRSSNDRNANLEVNYLLQRLENHDGIVLLTTNSATSIDEAFKRRLRFRIEFPTPDATEREALWRAMFPPRAPLARDIDFRALASRFQMAGGHIKNAVVRAAFLAAERATPVIDHQTLMQAATLEWTELGNLPI
ncbi:MAG TPA: ATP-binding protein [Kofleriaceae bacterium]|nr:ATP-binding protein [Kofleriaceae bacterium]